MIFPLVLCNLAHQGIRISRRHQYRHWHRCGWLYFIGHVTWAGCLLAQNVCNREIHLRSLVSLLSEPCTALLPRNGNPKKPVSTIFLMTAGSVCFFIRASVYAPVQNLRLPISRRWSPFAHAYCFTLNLLSEDQFKRPNTLSYTKPCHDVESS